MYKASRLFISERLRHSHFSVRQVEVKRHPIHDAQMCLENANRASWIDVLGSGSKQNPVVAGWLAHRYDTIRNVSEFVQHWWSFDPVACVYFDTTPLDNDVENWGFEYLIDDELLHVATTQLEKLEHTVGRDILRASNGWHSIEAISDNGEANLRPIKALSVDNLMHFKVQSVR